MQRSDPGASTCCPSDRPCNRAIRRFLSKAVGPMPRCTRTPPTHIVLDAFDLLFDRNLNLSVRPAALKAASAFTRPIVRDDSQDVLARLAEQGRGGSFSVKDCLRCTG